MAKKTKKKPAKKKEAESLSETNKVLTSMQKAGLSKGRFAKEHPKKKKEHSKLLRQEAEKFIKIAELQEQNPDLYNRAIYKVGMTNAMIATYPDAKSLKEVCDIIHPQSNPDAYPKRGSVPKPVIHTEKVPDKIEIDSNMEAKFISRNRAQFDEQNLQAELRRINRKYGSQNPVKIVKTTTFNQVNGKNADRVPCKVLVTHYEIYF